MVDQLTQTTESKPTFKELAKSVFYHIGNIFIRYPFALVATVFVVIGAVFLASFGKSVQIGGILGWLWGRIHPSQKPNAPTVIPVQDTPPPGRVDAKGDPIEPGTPDPKGYVQAPTILPIKDPGILSDPTTITVTHPDGKDVTIPLPTGVKNVDVKQVVLVAPNVYQISNNDTGADAAKILEDLN